MAGPKLKPHAADFVKGVSDPYEYMTDEEYEQELERQDAELERRFAKPAS